MLRGALAHSHFDEDDGFEGVSIETEEFICSKETFSQVSAALPPVLEKFALAASLAPYTESPIEVLFGVEFVTFVAAIGLKVAHCDHSEQNNFGRDCVLLIHQYPWKNYRIDWAIKVPFLRQPIFFVECDGRDFHSTEAQVTRDRIKDGEALRAGIPVFRFTGSDLDRNAAACVRVVYDKIETQYFSEKRTTLRQEITRESCRGCHFKVELAATLSDFASTLRSIYHFHSERGISVRQGTPERRYGQSQDFVRWYFKNVQDAGLFQKRFGGRLICSPVP
ncbi:MAG TPA: hypothetical protein VNR39_03670 [Pseudolabrys sp.]|nr:hypothetical protein [Pseudolabrys sp.]